MADPLALARQRLNDARKAEVAAYIRQADAWMEHGLQGQRVTPDVERFTALRTATDEALVALMMRATRDWFGVDFGEMTDADVLAALTAQESETTT